MTLKKEATHRSIEEKWSKITAWSIISLTVTSKSMNMSINLGHLTLLVSCIHFSKLDLHGDC